MRVLTFTSLFPNNIQQNLGGFIARRMSCWAENHASQWLPIAPVPYFPRLPFNSPWKKYSDVESVESFKQWEVQHLRYMMVPMIGLPFQGQSMAACTLPKVKELIIQKGPFDLIDAHFIYPDAYAALKISKQLDLPLVVSGRGSDINLYSQINSIRPKIIKVLKNADAVIGVSRDLIEKMISLGVPESKCHHIPNGIDSCRFFPIENKNEKSPLTNMLAVGNLVPEKGFHILLKAVSILKLEHPHIRLKIAGSGPQLNELSSMCSSLRIKENVQFIGQIRHQDMPLVFQRADILCLSSLREGNPNVVLEALASGLPVAATPVGGVPELIHNNINGWLSPDLSSEGLAGAISRVLTQKWSAEKIRNSVKNKTWDSVANKLQKVFKSVL
ncbi:glycosyltransferase [Desulfobacter postgatei]|uniref:glycosyltransferase n=1 Tax=Desulfobacter postgatei TaxID=2293 RepID=UPI00259BC06C|nr:glycosyltransferase [uncultured Desulfobacter sp.]